MRQIISSTNSLQGGTDDLGVLLGGERLWTLDWSTDSTVNDELRKDTNGAGNTEENGVVAGLGETVVLEEDTGVGIDVWIWVLGLAVLSENTWGDLVDLGDELEHWVVSKVLLGEDALSHVTWVSLAENGVAVTWNNTASLEGGPEVLLDLLIREIVADGLLHLGEPVKNLLVGETVKWASKTVKTGSERKHWGGESGSDQVGGVGGNVSTLVISVDSEVESHELNESLVVTETELVGVVEGVILVLLDWSNLAILVDVLVDAGSDGWELCNQVHGVLEGVSPVVLLIDALGVGLGEGRLVLKSVDGNGELSHWVKGAWAAVDELLDELWNIGAGGPLSREVANLLLRWNLTGEEKPEETFWEWLLSSWGLWKLVLALWDGQSAETDSLLGVENRSLPDEGADASGTTIDLCSVSDNPIEGCSVIIGRTWSRVTSPTTLLPWSLICCQLKFTLHLRPKQLATYLRSFLICSIFSGSCSAKRSLRV